MPTYIGFSTAEVCQPRTLARPGANGGMGGITYQPRISKKFRLVDEQLVIRDFINAFNIKQGDKVGQPGYGTTIWNYVFDPNTSELRSEVETEVRRVASLDPRIILNTIGVYTQTNGILIELEMAITPFNNANQVGFFLNRFNGSVQQLSQ
jgi:phage baseplate assembly protein W